MLFLILSGKLIASEEKRILLWKGNCGVKNDSVIKVNPILSFKKIYSSFIKRWQQNVLSAI